MRRIAQALRKVQLEGYSPSLLVKLGLQARLKQYHYAELLTPRADGPTCEAVSGDAIQGSLFDIPVKVASVASLLKLKEHAVASLAAERAKHLAAIELLDGERRRS